MTEAKPKKPRKVKAGSSDDSAAKVDMSSQAETNQTQANTEPGDSQPTQTEAIPSDALRRDAQNEVISPEAYAHLKTGVRFFKQQRLGEAESEIIQAIDLHPNLSPIYNIFGLLKIVRRAIDTLKQSVYSALTTDPEFMDEYVKAGIHLLAEQRFDEAEEQFKKAIALNERNTDARFRLGFTHVTQKKYRDAISVFEDLILLEPQNINAFFMLGMAYSEVREYYPCISNLQHALRLQPAFVEARLTLADAYHHQGKYLISLRELDALEKFIPDEDTTYLHRGMLLMEMERYEEALPHFERVIALKPDIMEAYELLLGLYDHLGYFDKGVELSKRALAIQPDNPNMEKILEYMEQRIANLKAAQG